jgi:hypothetical protein
MSSKTVTFTAEQGYAALGQTGGKHCGWLLGAQMVLAAESRNWTSSSVRKAMASAS